MDNAAKRRLEEGRGYADCYRCHKPLDQMHAMPRLCRACDRRRIRDMPEAERKARYARSNATTRERKGKDPEYRRRYNVTQNARRFGVTVAEYEELLTRPCDICGSVDDGSTRKRRLHVDHDHKTNKIRGVLCMNCNTALGKFRDDPELLRRALNYLGRLL